MKRKLFNIFCLISVFTISSLSLSAQSDSILSVYSGKIVDDPYFMSAYNEISSMLDGKDSLSVKRSAFLVEWAYLEGNLDYDEYCRKIDTTIVKLKYFIHINNLEQYKTAGNFALFEYFTKPNLLNGNKPFTYDFDDFTGDADYRKTFVTKVMETHSGQCRSLPLYYKILSDELGAESYIALAPNHSYVKHIDEYGRWVNIELTNGHFATDAWMISSMDISAEAIKNKIYLDALSQKETVAMLLVDLSLAYTKKYELDDFSLMCSDKSLEYYPHYIVAFFTRFNTLQKIGLDYVDKYGQTPSPYVNLVYSEYRAVQKKVESLGYRERSKESYEAWIKSVEQEKEKQNTVN